MSFDDTSKDPTRRRVMGGLTAGAGLVAAATFPAAAQTSGNDQQSGFTASTDQMGQAELQNPSELYPRPPFPRQTQEPPGLAAAMEPRPDHGERSYRGAGRLAGRKALVTGGDSGIGRAAVIAFAREGADIAFNYLPVRSRTPRRWCS